MAPEEIEQESVRCFMFKLLILQLRKVFENNSTTVSTSNTTNVLNESYTTSMVSNEVVLLKELFSEEFLKDHFPKLDYLIVIFDYLFKILKL